MITLVTGKQNSGKSAFAERLAAATNWPGRYYIATMKVVDDDSARRKQEHIMERAHLGFETLEIPCMIDGAPELMIDPKKCVVLLECMANLVANIMHEPEWAGRISDADSESADEFVRIVILLVRSLAEKVGQLIVVTSEYELETDDMETVLYVKMLDAVNARLKRIADKVYTQDDLIKG